MFFKFLFPAAGAIMDNDVVVTVGHRLQDYVGDVSQLSVRLGDWNPNKKDSIEEYPHIEVSVACVKIHPNADLKGTLANNIAVLKLGSKRKIIQTEFVRKSVLDVVSPRKGPKRPANKPSGVEGFSVVDGVSELDVALGLVSDLNSNLLDDVPKSYINTVCLPKSESQFKDIQENCWLAAWGTDLERQREVDLPLVSKEECELRLRPVFKEKEVPNWSLHPSEVCAGGVPDKDACEGEGGAPLVCYDKVSLYFCWRQSISTIVLQSSDQYFAVGLVNYGFDCFSDKPAVYTNLANPEIQSFITSAFENESFC